MHTRRRELENKKKKQKKQKKHKAVEGNELPRQMRIGGTKRRAAAVVTNSKLQECAMLNGEFSSDSE